MKKSALAAFGSGLAALALLGAWYLQHRESKEGPGSVELPAAEPAPATAAVAPSAASEPGPRYPIEAIEAPAAAASQAGPDAQAVLTGLFGRKAVLALFQLDDFPRRVAATVDNLGRKHASPLVWPMNPAEGRFLTEKRGDAEVISADNGLRYTPYVLLIETVNLRQLVAAYVRLYPLFQSAYEQLGYPKGYFNDRLIEVLDELIATPEVEDPIEVFRPVVNGPIQPQRPWVLYEFADPALQSLGAGQKILLRTGSVNARRLVARLIELRRLLVAGAAKP